MRIWKSTLLVSIAVVLLLPLISCDPLITEITRVQRTASYIVIDVAGKGVDPLVSCPHAAILIEATGASCPKISPRLEIPISTLNASLASHGYRVIRTVSGNRDVSNDTFQVSLAGVKNPKKAMILICLSNGTSYRPRISLKVK
jgi:hypothetical protein